MYDPYENRRERFDLKLARAVDRQEFVRFDDETLLLYCWNGSLTINVYALNGECVDMFMMGFRGDEPREILRDEAMKRIADRIEGKEAGDDDDD